MLLWTFDQAVGWSVTAPSEVHVAPSSSERES
jgi:hypothetical protein